MFRYKLLLSITLLCIQKFNFLVIFIAIKNVLNFTSIRSKAAKFRATYKNDYFNVDGDVDLQMTGPVFRGSSVFV